MDALTSFFNVFGDLGGGFATALQPFNILMLFVGVVLGLVVRIVVELVQAVFALRDAHPSNPW